MAACLICSSTVTPFLSFGKMPIANGFLTAEEFDREPFFDLEVGFCPRCTMAQLTSRVDPKLLFHEAYAFYSSTSHGMIRHFQRFAETVEQSYLDSAQPFVVEIGSNDGIMLQHFANKKIQHLGIEPSANVAQVAKEKGVNTRCAFFDEALAKAIVAEYGQADAVLAANVMCHIPDLHAVAAGIKTLLKPQGVLVFEDPYLGDIVEKTSYDQFYDEHVFYFSVTSVSALFREHGLEVVGLAPQDVHGGSMRYVLAHAGSRPVSAAVAAQQAKEKRLGLDSMDTYARLRGNVERSRDRLRALLTELREKGKRVAGYGATSKSTTVTNYCGLTPDLIEFISDTTPIKQGKFSPGTHIPVRDYQEFVARYPDYAVLFAWNHRSEIVPKEKPFIEYGGRFITYVPDVEMISS